MNGEIDKLYNIYRQTKEEREKANFKAIMGWTDYFLTDDLDKAYASGDMNEYNRMLGNIKERGIRVFRNADGKHKLKWVSEVSE